MPSDPYAPEDGWPIDLATGQTGSDPHAAMAVKTRLLAAMNKDAGDLGNLAVCWNWIEHYDDTTFSEDGLYYRDQFNTYMQQISNALMHAEDCMEALRTNRHKPSGT